MQPLLTYFEKRYNGSRMFLLYPDRIEVSGKQRFGSEFRSVVPLEGVRPEFNRVFVRYGDFHAAHIFLAISVILAVAFLGIFDYPALGCAMIVPLSVAIASVWPATSSPPYTRAASSSSPN